MRTANARPVVMPTTTPDRRVGGNAFIGRCFGVIHAAAQTGQCAEQGILAGDKSTPCATAANPLT